MFQMGQISFVFFSLCLQVLFCADAFAQTELKLRFQSGQPLNYLIKQDVTTEMTVGTNNITSKMNQQTHMQWSPKQRTANGGYLMDQVIRRIQLQMTLPPPVNQKIAYDTANPQPIAGPLGGMTSQFDDMIDAPCQLEMSPTGVITNVQFSPKFDQAAQNTANAASLGGTDKVRQLIEQGSIPLPQAPVKIGDQWQRTLSVPAKFGTLQTLLTYTYRGVDSTGLDRIEVQSMVRVIPAPDAIAEVQITQSNGTGYLLFDNKAGYLKQSVLKKVVGMSITAGGQNVLQTVTTNVVMTYQN